MTLFFYVIIMAMKINNLENKTSFGKVYCGGTIINRLGKENCPQEFKNGYKSLRAALEARDLDKLDRVNLTLNYAEKDGFFATVSSKEYGIPEVDQYKHKVSTNEDHLDVFEEWAYDWNFVYSELAAKAYANVRNAVRFIKENYKF